MLPLCWATLRGLCYIWQHIRPAPRVQSAAEGGACRTHNAHLIQVPESQQGGRCRPNRTHLCIQKLPWLIAVAAQAAIKGAHDSLLRSKLHQAQRKAAHHAQTPAIMAAHISCVPRQPVLLGWVCCCLCWPKLWAAAAVAGTAGPAHQWHNAKQLLSISSVLLLF